MEEKNEIYNGESLLNATWDTNLFIIKVLIDSMKISTVVYSFSNEIGKQKC